MATAAWTSLPWLRLCWYQWTAVYVTVLPGGQHPVLVPVQQEEDLLAVRDLGGGQRQSWLETRGTDNRLATAPTLTVSAALNTSSILSGLPPWPLILLINLESCWKHSVCRYQWCYLPTYLWLLWKWLCWARFSSPFIFAEFSGLLHHPNGVTGACKQLYVEFDKICHYNLWHLTSHIVQDVLPSEEWSVDWAPAAGGMSTQCPVSTLPPCPAFHSGGRLYWLY